MLIAMVSGMASLALRDGGEDRLEREALRLSALLEAGRAEARASGLAVRFELASADARQACRVRTAHQSNSSFSRMGFD